MSHSTVVDGLKRQAHLWAVMGFSTEFWKQELWRALGFESKEAFLEGFLEAYFTALDPNDLLTMAWKWQHGDVARHTSGDLAAALGRITAKTFVIPVDEDMFFPPRDCSAEQTMVPGSELRIVEDVLGHLACSVSHPPTCPSSTATSRASRPGRLTQASVRQHPARRDRIGRDDLLGEHPSSARWFRSCPWPRGTDT